VTTIATPEHLRRLPKVELHCHVEGAARASTIAELAAHNDVPLPVDDPNDLFEFSGLNQFLEIYDVICRSLRTADDFHRITYEALEDGARAGVRYREMFFSPGFVVRLGVPVATVWQGIRAGVIDARRDLGVGCRMVLDIDKPSGPAHAIEMARFAGSEPDRDLLVGMGGDSVERGIDHASFAAAFDEAARYGLRRTMHAGEDGPAANIAIALDVLGCERIDHGFRLFDDSELTKRVVDQRIPLTVCPTSNVVIAHVVPDVAAHPFAGQRAAGVLATLNSDDPGMMRFDVGDEYVAVASAYGYSLDEMERISLDGIEASWAPDDEKRARRVEFLTEFDALRAEFGLPVRAATVDVEGGAG
jgi:adenosine deaminase